MSEKERYRTLCEERGADVPLFQQAWWLDAVCEGKEWSVLLANQADGIVAGVLPYVKGRKWGLRYALQPQMTPWLGPWVDPRLKAENQRRVLTDLVQQLDALHLALYQQCCAPSLHDWMPFYWNNYHQTTRYTYRFDPLLPLADLMAKAEPQRRKRMDRLQSELVVDKNVDVAEFAALHHRYHVRRSGHCTLKQSLVEHVCATALQRGQALLYGVRNHDGQLQGADFVVFDSHCAYSLLSGYEDSAPRNTSTFLFWHLMDDLYGRTEAFDFEGSMERGTEPFFRSFGAVQTPYHCLYRTRPRLLQLMLKL